VAVSLFHLASSLHATNGLAGAFFPEREQPLTSMMMLRYTFSVLVLAAVIAGCGMVADPAAPVRAVTTTENGLEFRAEVRMPRSDTAAAGPAMIQPAVRITNRTSASVEVMLDGCPVRLDIHRDAERAGPPAWSTDGPGRQCMQAPYSLRLGPGGSEEVSDAWDGAGVLSQLGAPGRYHFTITLRTLPNAMVLPAGSAEITFGTEQLSYRASSSLEGVSPPEVHTAVTVTNAGRGRVRLEYGACSMTLRAFRTPERTGTPAWDAARRPNPDPATGIYWACPLYLATKELQPGESHSPNEFRSRIPGPQILGDSLPDGRYYLVARVGLNGVLTDVPAGEVELRGR
jgi:hypothetical protein